MTEIKQLCQIKNFPVSFTLGSFDGLHKGHSVLIRELKDRSVSSGTASLVISFHPHPRKIVDDSYEIKLLNTKEEKTDLIGSYGIDYIHFIRFTKEFSGISYNDFYKNYIFSCLTVRNIIAGTNHMFGENRKGDNELLSQLCSDHDVELISVPPVLSGGKTISSTRIRRCIEGGNVEDASEMLGYNYFIRGNVIKGKGLGSSLGFATANMNITNTEKAVPGKGVYFTSVKTCGKIFYGVSNIGENPTFGGTGLNLETHIFDLDSDLYGKTIETAFIKRLRDEIKFASKEELADAVKNDIVKGKELELKLRKNL